MTFRETFVFSLKLPTFTAPTTVGRSLIRLWLLFCVSDSIVLYWTETRRPGRYLMENCTVSYSNELKSIIGFDCLYFCCSFGRWLLIISILHIILYSLGEHNRSSEMNSVFCYMSENQRFNLKFTGRLKTFSSVIWYAQERRRGKSQVMADNVVGMQYVCMTSFFDMCQIKRLFWKILDEFWPLKLLSP